MVFDDYCYSDNDSVGLTPFDSVDSNNECVGITPFDKSYFDSIKYFDHNIYNYLVDTCFKNESKITQNDVSLFRIRKTKARYKRIHKDRVDAYNNAHKLDKSTYDRNRRRNRMQFWIDKFNGVCSWCGCKVDFDNYNIRPEFHHTIPENKKHNISDMLDHGYSENEIQEEFNTGGVILLCHNCHNAESGKQKIKICEFDRNEIRNIFNSGNVTKTELANKYNCDIGTITYILNEKGC